MEYDGMSRRVVNQDGKHQWNLMIQSMSKLKEGKNNNDESINTSKAYNCLCVVHDAWWHAKPFFTTYKWPQLRKGTHRHYLWDGYAPNVSIDDWGITYG